MIDGGLGAGEGRSGHRRAGAVIRPSGPRVLIYSHDSFGLGHLRRCRTIAHALVDARDDVSVLILSGSPIIGSFDFRSRVDFVRVPGVIKLEDGEYSALSLPFGIDETLAIRESIIRHTAGIFAPDLFLVDKEPLGLRGEIEPTLEALRERGTSCILGLRDVLDDPEQLAREWARKKAGPALVELYDEIWVYGLPQICDPLEGLDLPAPVRAKTRFTGFLKREAAEDGAVEPARIDGIGAEVPFLLVTTGGGGDGIELIDWVLRAYEAEGDALPLPALLVLGPFMAPDAQAAFLHRAARLRRVEAITFDAHVERLMARATAVVAMGGYNTFCEILSFDKPALIVPRAVPRREQLIRARRAQALCLATLLEDDGVRDARVMADALRALPGRPLPSEAVVPGLLEGLPNLIRLAERHLQATEPVAGQGRHG